MKQLPVIRLFLSKLFSDRAVWLLPVTAFAIVSALALIVIAGARFIAHIPGDFAVMYISMAVLAVLFLAVPMSALAGAAAKLLARRRDERLSSLRLLGASSFTVYLVALSEAVVLATTGILLGVLGYVALMPLVGLLSFGGQPMGVAGLWLGFPWLASTVGALILFAAAASMTGLRKIHITPLGARTRQQASKVHWVRILLALGIFVAAQILAKTAGAFDIAVAVTLTLAALAVPLVALYFLGPWLLKIVAARIQRKTKDVRMLVAARTVLESPQQAWRQVGGLAATVYIGLVGGAGMAMIRAATADGFGNGQDAVFFTDVQNGVLLTLLISFLLVACSVGITQTAQVLDRTGLYQGLDKIGMAVPTMNSIRRRAVFTPVWVVLVVAVIGAAVTALPVVGAAMVLDPLTMLVVFGCIGLGLALLAGGVQAAAPTLRRVIA